MKTHGIFLGDKELIDRVWSQRTRARLRQYCQLDDRVWKATDLVGEAARLRDVQVVFSTWEMPMLTSDQLEALPKLEAVFYAAGTVRNFAGPLWERGVIVCSAWQANGVPVAEFTLAQIILGLKRVWPHVQRLREIRSRAAWQTLPVCGAYGAKVGLVSLGVIGRRVVEWLRLMDVQVLAYDPWVSEEQARHLGVTKVSLEELFDQCEVVSIHTPWLKETERMIHGDLIRRMKSGATLINTARGAVIAEDEMIEVLRQRPDLTAVLDVTHPEPPQEGSPLYTLPNVVLTPHIAGSIGQEVQRMAEWMADEFESWVHQRPLRFAVSREMAERMA